MSVEAQNLAMLLGAIVIAICIIVAIVSVGANAMARARYRRRERFAQRHGYARWTNDAHKQATHTHRRRVGGQVRWEDDQR